MRAPPVDYVSYFLPDVEIEGELSVSPFWYVLWTPDEIETMNRDYQVDQYAPEYLGFGSSGGGEMFAFDGSGRVFCIPFVGMSSQDALPVADSWTDFLALMKAGA